ncbi:hypothetical protein LHYA1_G000979 [Lachnellula hyalina]|uniref:Uncharacterized protein n=1 Tax=Lachnellula hyalina TaxID=1316788 RepID=A0A8H8R6S9_9HELO|nr:uncharacterized protein LHYA1_G000979 [Lachnellula hyalina]TVY29643.1 hypothetical protein LHYA1_G000979 [Lachnellula hyalina]
MAPKDQPSSSSASTWIWFPTSHELRTHYLKEIGFLACLSQMIGATVFWISGFTALPPIFDRLTSTAAQNGAYWAPQVIGGSGFIISGTLFMLETQQKWYLPAPRVLGWHIGVWNLIGVSHQSLISTCADCLRQKGIGFTLCGALGFASANSGCVYQGSLATFWGSWCFLIGSAIQRCIDIGWVYAVKQVGSANINHITVLGHRRMPESAGRLDLANDHQYGQYLEFPRFQLVRIPVFRYPSQICLISSWVSRRMSTAVHWLGHAGLGKFTPRSAAALSRFLPAVHHILSQAGSDSEPARAPNLSQSWAAR